MSEESPLELRKLTEQVEIVLSKKGVKPSVMVQVGFATDVSLSLKHAYEDGTMQKIINRLQGLANRFDDNQTLDMWMFSNDGTELEPAVPRMFGSYVNNHILNQGNRLWHGTLYAPVLHMVCDHYFGSVSHVVEKVTETATSFIGKLFGKKAGPTEPILAEIKAPGNGVKLPVYLTFLTDGDTYDETETYGLIKSLSKENIYIQMVGVGTGSTFKFLKDLAKEFNHVGFVDFSEPSKVTDEQMYSALLNDEFINWLKGVK